MRRIKQWIKNLIEKIFRRKELADSKEALDICKDHLDTCRKKRDLLIEMNTLLTTGDSVQLTQNERKMVLNAIEFKPFREVIEEPRTKRADRDTWKGLREKIKACLDEVVSEDDDTR